MTSISLFCYWEKVITHMNIWTIAKNLMKHYYSHLNLKNITDAGYTHAKRVCKDFKIKHLGE